MFVRINITMIFLLPFCRSPPSFSHTYRKRRCDINTFLFIIINKYSLLLSALYCKSQRQSSDFFFPQQEKELKIKCCELLIVIHRSFARAEEDDDDKLWPMIKRVYVVLPLSAIKLCVNYAKQSGNKGWRTLFYLLFLWHFLREQKDLL